MIKIENEKVIVEGTYDEIEDDFFTLIMTLNKNPIGYSKIGFGIGFENFEKFDIENLMLMIFTCMSVEEKQFHNFLKMIYKILEKCESGEFKLLYKEISDKK